MLLRSPPAQLELRLQQLLLAFGLEDFAQAIAAGSVAGLGDFVERSLSAAGADDAFTGGRVCSLLSLSRRSSSSLPSPALRADMADEFAVGDAMTSLGWQWNGSPSRRFHSLLPSDES